MGNLQFGNKFTNENIDGYLLKCKKLENHLVYEMMIYNTKISDEAIIKLWDIYFGIM